MDDRELLDRIAEKVGKIDVLVEAQKRLEENQAKMEGGEKWPRRKPQLASQSLLSCIG